MAIIQGGTSGALLEVGATNKAGRVELYDANGNLLAVQNGVAVPISQAALLVGGVSAGASKLARTDVQGTIRSTSETPLFEDPIEAAAINASLWTSSVATMTIAQASHVITLNANNTTTIATDAIITSVTQFWKMKKQPLWTRFRARFAWQNGAVLEVGFANPVGTTAAVANGAFLRVQSGGNVVGVIANNSVETVTATLAMMNVGMLTSTFYDIDVIFYDDRARFIVQDSGNTPVIDTTLAIPLGQSADMLVSHIPVAARIYNNTAPAVAAQLLVSEAIVVRIDALSNKPWPHVVAGMMKSAQALPVTGAQAPQLAAGAAPAAITPSNTVAGVAALGGEYLINATATSENLLSVFTYTIGLPYNFYLTGIQIPAPLNGVVAVATTATILEWAVIANCATADISTGGGQRIALPGWQTAAIGLAAGAQFSGDKVQIAFATPVFCQSGTVFHVAVKVITGTATATETYRGQVLIDGYHE